jgi:16S rRNA (uracil1498-N3)-methyltransferase
VQAPRFFVDRPLSVEVRIELPAAVVHHACRVLRLREGDTIVLFNGQGGEYRARLAGAPHTGAGLQAELIGFDPIEREPWLRITLIQALATSDKIDWVIEKAVELGVARVIVGATARSTARLDPARQARRLQHWRELAIAACCQCGRNRPMPVLAAGSLAEALAQVADADTRWILDPAALRSLPTAHLESPTVALAIGPEGGFDAAETQLAAQAGFAPISLGPRILRTETAGLAAAAALLVVNGGFSAQPD